MTNLDSILKSRDITLLTKVHLVKAMVFPVWMESWTIEKAECWRTNAFRLWCWRRLLRVPWTARRSKPVNPTGNRSWTFTGRIDAETETPIVWPPDVKNWLMEKTWCWKRLKAGEGDNEMAGWHHQLDGLEFKQALGAGDSQGSLACCSPWGHKKSDMTDWLNWTES